MEHLTAIGSANNRRGIGQLADFRFVLLKQRISLKIGNFDRKPEEGDRTAVKACPETPSAFGYLSNAFSPFAGSVYPVPSGIFPG